MQRRPVLTCLALALTSGIGLAQINATYATFGAGCSGTGTGLGNMSILPAPAATAFGSGNAIPFGWSPNKYQQVFLGSEIPNALTMAALSLRQPHIGPTAHNFTIDVEISVGYTTRWLPTISTTFASNWDAGAAVVVLPRQLVDFPDQPTTLPTNPTDFLVTIPWTNTFDWVPMPGRNLLIEVTVFGNSNGNFIYGYPIDNVSGTISMWGTPATATTANGGPVRGFGPAMGFVEQTHTAIPELFSTDTPQIGNTFKVRVAQAAPSTLALISLAWSANSWNGYALPLDLGFLGAPGCRLLANSVDLQVRVTDGQGKCDLEYDLPNNIYALGSNFYNQAFVLDPLANALGLVTSNGGWGVFGNQ